MPRKGAKSRNLCANKFAEVCRCATSNCCPPGLGLVYTQHFISIKCTYRCLLFKTSIGFNAQKEKKEKVYASQKAACIEERFPNYQANKGLW
eukprot:1143029-Pelagomonas_calceolata.AAC.5